MLIPGEKARQLRFLFEAPERCIDGAAVNLFGARFPVLKHVR
jgi:hypothetical protein